MELTVADSDGIENPADAAQNPPTGFRPRKSGFPASTGRQGFASQVSPCAPSGIGYNLSGADGDDAHHYQEKQVRNAIREAAK